MVKEFKCDFKKALNPIGNLQVKVQLVRASDSYHQKYKARWSKICCARDLRPCFIFQKLPAFQLLAGYLNQVENPSDMHINIRVPNSFSNLKSKPLLPKRKKNVKCLNQCFALQYTKLCFLNTLFYISFFIIHFLKQELTIIFPKLQEI